MLTILPKSSGCFSLSVFFKRVQRRSRTCCKMEESTTLSTLPSWVGLCFSPEESSDRDSETAHGYSIESLFSSFGVEE